MQQLDEQLNTIFAGTFRDFGNWFGDPSLASSIDLREQKDKYVVRVYVPGNDTSKVNARVENGMLHVTATGQQSNNGMSKSERYEQMISLPGPVQSNEMKIERKENLVVITLPKSANATASNSPAASASPGAGAMPGFGFDQAIVNRMARMQGRMEQLFRDAFPEDLTSGLNTLRLGSAFHIDDQKDKYVVHFYRPDEELKNVDVKLENGQLCLTASQKQSSDDEKSGTSRTEIGRYEEAVTLPGPVKAKGMKVERKDGTIVVTLPKA